MVRTMLQTMMKTMVKTMMKTMMKTMVRTMMKTMMKTMVRIMMKTMMRIMVKTMMKTMVRIIMKTMVRIMMRTMMRTMMKTKIRIMTKTIIRIMMKAMMKTMMRLLMKAMMKTVAQPLLEPRTVTDQERVASAASFTLMEAGLCSLSPLCRTSCSCRDLLPEIPSSTISSTSTRQACATRDTTLPQPGAAMLYNIYINIDGLQQTLSSTTHNKYICQKKEKRLYIAAGTGRMLIEPSAKH